MTTEFETSKIPQLQQGKNFRVSLPKPKTAGILLTIALLCVFGLPQAAQAQSSSLEASYQGSLKTVKKTTKSVNAKKPGARVAIKASYLGRAPWICTPSGFGRTSSCFAR